MKRNHNFFLTLALIAGFILPANAAGNYENFVINFYNNCVFGDKWNAESHITSNVRQRLVEEFDEDCYDGGCLALWEFRTGYQDGPGDYSYVSYIEPYGGDWYKVNYFDMGMPAATYVRVTNGKISDYCRSAKGREYDRRGKFTDGVAQIWKTGRWGMSTRRKWK